MPYRTIPNSSTRYALIAFDGNGSERSDDSDGVTGRFSARILDDVSSDVTITDVFLFSHGWMGDIPAAIDQYDHWIGAMEARAAEKDRMVRLRPNFKPLRVGVHWPSKPWGDEEFGAAAFALPTMHDPVNLYLARLGDRPGLREAVTTVMQEAARHPDAERLSSIAEKAYRDINNLMVELGASGAGAAPGSDREPFDPQSYFDAARQEASFGLSSSLGGVLAPLRQLSFWKMKQRALQVGEGGLHSFLADLQQATSGRDLRFHLMGHSFGSIVVSAMLCGPSSGAGATNAASVALVQGALSLWSYCSSIPVAAGQRGYFVDLLERKKVTGPILTTRSVFDTANGRFYPLGAGIANQISFAPGDFPRYGALGSFGAQGLVPAAAETSMRKVTEDYNFASGQVYNIDASEFVRAGSGPAGAHNDISGPEVAHAIWQAALPC